MAIQGLRDTSNFVANQRPENWREAVLMRYPNGKAPLLALTSMMKKRSTDDFKFHWWEKELNTRRYQMASSATALTTSNTSITLATGQSSLTLKNGDLLRVEESGEILLITSDPTTALEIPSVSRGFGDTEATALDTSAAGKNPHLMYMGSA